MPRKWKLGPGNWDDESSNQEIADGLEAYARMEERDHATYRAQELRIAAKRILALDAALALAQGARIRRKES